MLHVPDDLPTPEPDSYDLKRARRITLGRLPASTGALALTDAVTTEVLAQRTEGRPVGPKGIPRHRDEVGRIIGGLLRSHYRLDRLSSAARRTDAEMWQTLGRLIGNHAFWSKVDALKRAGLVGEKKGIQTPSGGPLGGFGGSPAVLWPTDRLLALAGLCGVSRATFARDWPFNEAPSVPRIILPHEDLVAVSALPRVDPDTGRRIGGDTPRLPVGAEWAAEVETMARQVAALNNRVAAVSVEGCTAPVFQRKFKGDLRLGGRLYALGDDNYQAGLDRMERRALRIGGEPVVEVDLSASFLSIFLTRMGVALPDGDPYAAVDAPREAVKALLVQSFGNGQLATRWAPDTDAAVVAMGKPKPVREALLAAFPALRDMRKVLPEDLMEGLPAGLQGWAVGQHLTFLESKVVLAALDAVQAVGGMALPLHDSLLAPRSAADRAAHALTEAFGDQIGVRPRVVVK